MAALRRQLSDRDLAVIGQVASLKLMDARQIEAVHFGDGAHASRTTATRTCRRVLERLVERRLLVRLERRVGGVRAGSASYIYALGPVGQRVIELDGPRRRYREPTAAFVDHTLAVAQVVVNLTVGARAGAFDLISVEPEPTCWRPFASLGGRQLLRPDLFVCLGVGDFEVRWFIEVDRGQESLPVLVRKCQAYEAYYRSGTEQERHGVFPRACWIVPDKRRAVRLHQALGDNTGLTTDLFVTAVHDEAVAVLTEAGR